MKRKERNIISLIEHKRAGIGHNIERNITNNTEYLKNSGVRANLTVRTLKKNVKLQNVI